MRVRTALVCAVGALVWGAPALAQATDVESLREALAKQEETLAAQQKMIDEQRLELSRQKAALDTVLGSQEQARPLDLLSAYRAGQAQPQPVSSASASGSADADPDQIRPITPAQPVGEGPPLLEPSPELAALPEGVGVLTPRGRWVLDPSIDYTLSSSDRLVFRGVEIVTGVQIGVIEASDVERQTFGATLAARYGLSDRAEVEVRIPYVFRNDEITTLVQREDQVSQTMQLEGQDIGDIELTGRYQINAPTDGGPVFVGNLRYKTATGSGPLEVERDSFGVATELPTGSGFWGLEPSLTVLLPSDPAVIFANVGYFYHAPDDVNRGINGVQVGRVDPGDSVNASLGFGFSLNPRFSFSLGYRHSYIMETETELNGIDQTSDDFQVGAIQFGWSYRLNERTTFNNNFEFGVTEDAPDLRVVFRAPFVF